VTVLRRVFDFYRTQGILLWTWRPGRRALVRRALISFVVAFASLGLTVLILPGIRAPGPSTIALATIALAAINLLIRPLILGLFAGISVVAILLATLIFQVVVFYLVSLIVPEFQVRDALTALVASFLYATFDMLLVAILSVDQDDSYYGVLMAQLSRRRADVVRTDRPGVVIIQIDGLSHPVLAHQIRAGRVPNIGRSVRSHEMRLDRWVALLPSQTSASQAGILYGKNDFIPAFRWWDKARGRLVVSNHPDDAAEIARRASDGHGLLADDGASIGNLLSGDAVRSYITMATIRDRAQGLGQSRSFQAFFASPTSYLRTLILTIAEVVKELVQARRAAARGIEPAVARGLPFPLARAATNVALRALSTSLVIEEMYRGSPVIYVDYVDYDEIAHFSGPERGEALDALDGVDRTIGALRKAAREAPRPYRFVVLSDHGQSLGATFRQRYGQSLQEVVAGLMGGIVEVGEAPGTGEGWGSLNAAASEMALTTGRTGAITRRAFRGRSSDGAIDLGRRSARSNGPRRGRLGRLLGRPMPLPLPVPPRATESVAGEPTPPELVVCASGNFALIYFPRLPERASLETIEASWPGLVGALADHPGIGLLMVRSEAEGTLVYGPDGARQLEGDDVDGADPLTPFGRHARTGLRRVDGMADCGDLVVVSLLDTETDEVAAFEELIGSHGGLGGDQTKPFILHPSEWRIDGPLIGAEDVYRQLRHWLERLGVTDAGDRATAGDAAAGGVAAGGVAAERLPDDPPVPQP
jgi:uncharacterized membrane protein YvlD (DUF360 family)